MILTGMGIASAVECGDIVIKPFDPAALNPNSYNYRLDQIMRICTDEVIDPRAPLEISDIEISPTGLLLMPGRIYLGRTVEVIGSRRYVPSLIGRSSLGRLGMFLQVSADLGNIGAIHRWTLEIVVCQPILVYPGMKVGQVSFWCPEGENISYAGFFGRFSHAELPQPGQFL